MKVSFRKLKPKVINYRNYKHFCNENYRNELVTEYVWKKVLDKYAPLKSKFVPGNHSPFIYREPSKAIMTSIYSSKKNLKKTEL